MKTGCPMLVIPQAKQKSVILTCRHFGLHRSYFYRWYKRFKKYGIKGLEEYSHKPKSLRKEGIKQYWARAHKPKDKPYIEHFIGTMQRELLNFNYRPFTVEELQNLVDEWIEEYEKNRPHESLGILTPNQFEAKFNRERLLYQSKVYLALHSIRDYDVS